MHKLRSLLSTAISRDGARDTEEDEEMTEMERGRGAGGLRPTSKKSQVTADFAVTSHVRTGTSAAPINTHGGYPVSSK